jgi:hypothetical protein
MRQSVYGLVRTQALHVAATLGIADLIADGYADLPSLAKAAQTDARSLGRLLRFLVSEGIFTIDAQQRYALTPSGELLRAGVPGSIRHMAIFYGSEFVWGAWAKLEEGVRSGKTPFELALGQRLFDYLQAHPDHGRIADAYMTEIPGLHAVAAAHDYSGARTVVDVAGGQGASIAAVLQANPEVRGILFDQASVVATSRAILDAAGVTDRCEVRAGSFFDAVPEGGDVYILSNILHDWGDEDCLRILTTCRCAMRPGAKLLIIEAIVPEGNPQSFVSIVDLQMMVTTGGLQRTKEEFGSLLAATGFRSDRLIPSPRGAYIEAIAV